MFKLIDQLLEAFAEIIVGQGRWILSITDRIPAWVLILMWVVMIAIFFIAAIIGVTP